MEVYADEAKLANMVSTAAENDPAITALEIVRLVLNDLEPQIERLIDKAYPMRTCKHDYVKSFCPHCKK